MIIELSSTNYGGFVSHNWTLKVYGKSFYLGQDGKFCSRVLGMHPRDVAQAIGTNDLRTSKARTSLARMIVNNLGITRSNIKTLSAWDICAE